MIDEKYNALLGVSTEEYIDKIVMPNIAKYKIPNFLLKAGACLFIIGLISGYLLYVTNRQDLEYLIAVAAMIAVGILLVVIFYRTNMNYQDELYRLLIGYIGDVSVLKTNEEGDINFKRDISEIPEIEEHDYTAIADVIVKNKIPVINFDYASTELNGAFRFEKSCGGYDYVQVSLYYKDEKKKKNKKNKDEDDYILVDMRVFDKVLKIDEQKLKEENITVSAYSVSNGRTYVVTEETFELPGTITTGRKALVKYFRDFISTIYDVEAISEKIYTICKED